MRAASKRKASWAVSRTKISAMIVIVSRMLGGASAHAEDAYSLRESAPVDLTGYWVALITEDWLYRMRTPPPGDYSSVPLNEEGRRTADAWKPGQGDPCMPYGAPALMRMPTRLHIYWEGDESLRIDTDTASQTRLIRGQQSSGAAKPSRQGDSTGIWESTGDGGAIPFGGSLKVTTINLIAGYLRTNGVPYSEHARLTEYFSRTDEDDGASYLIVTSIVDDPQYLTEPFVTSSHFRRIANRSGWQPTTCSEG